MILELFRAIVRIVLYCLSFALFGYMSFWSFSWLEKYEAEAYPPKQVPYYVNEFVLWIDELFGIGVSDLLNAHLGFYSLVLGFIWMCLYASDYRKSSDENNE